MKAWLVTFSIFNSRVSERAAYYRKNNKEASQPILLTSDEQDFVIDIFHKTAQKYSLLMLRLVVLPDHVHMIVMAEDRDKLSEVMHKIKGASGYYLNRKRNMPKGTTAWTKKFDCQQITDMRHLEKACIYIDNNHIKHSKRYNENG